MKLNWLAKWAIKQTFGERRGEAVVAALESSVVEQIIDMGNRAIQKRTEYETSTAR